MDDRIALIRSKTEQLIEAIDDKLPDDTLLNANTNRWHDPAIKREDLTYEVKGIFSLLDECDYKFNLEKLPTEDIAKRLDHLRTKLVPHLMGDPDRGVASFSATLNSIKDWLKVTAIKPESEDLSADLNRERKRIRALTARINDLVPKTEDLDSILKQIEAAHQAADDLPTDLEALSESRDQVRSLTKSAMTDTGAIASHLEDAKKAKEYLDQMASSASSIIANCQSAYSAATSVGLAAAFHERAKHLQLIGAAWVAGLIAALFIAATFGASQLTRTSDLLAAGNASGWTISLSALLSMLSLGAPVWFSWLSTRQIGQNFRLAEDYAFKASVSRAYEGYRSEAARIDSDLEVQLLASALSRLDEQPLRLIETSSPSSPLAEILQSDAVRTAAKIVPEFASEVKALASRLLPATPKKKTKEQPLIHDDNGS